MKEFIGMTPTVRQAAASFCCRLFLLPSLEGKSPEMAIHLAANWQSPLK
jgi:hypothetical protein